MNLIEAIMARHSVRSYETRPLADDVVAKLQESINQYNTVSGLRTSTPGNAKGIRLEQTVYEDGNTATRKVMK